QREGGVFPDDPDVTRDLEIPVSLNTGGDRFQLGSSVVASVDGDYDGDGVKDLLYRTDNETLGVFRGLPGRRLAESPAGEAEVPDLDAVRFTLPYVHDLDGDGRADVVLRYWTWDKDADRLILLLSRAK
ncbi:MAG: VCBS repeat-containing protein, partial [Phycisphaerales bacterium]|nr:VCBS repeat-containing protein [Phycisphaerales bacterium]